MNSNYAIPVHICSLCGKPFTQERQHQRHQAYCRKNQSRPRTRPRSCRACNQAKIKCNFRAPCNQCARKEVDCVYDQPRKELAVNDAPVRIDSPGSSSNSNGLESIPTSTLLGEMLDTDSLGLVHPGYVPDHGSDDLFAISATELDRSKHKDLHPIGDPPMPTALSSEMDSFMSLLQSDDFDFALHASTCKSLDFVPPVQPPTHLPIPGTEISTTAVHFSRNKIMTPAQQLFTSMLIDMIRAYPLMMTRRETFPPFVHPHCYLYEGCDTFPQVLTNCMGIAQLFVSCTDDTRPFVWTTVMTEVRSVMNKLGSMNKFELFSALQASLLYLIMRAIETETQQSAQDLELIRAHEIICDYTLQQIGTHTVPEVNDPRRQWKDWIFDESVKRVAWVWFSLSVVYYIRSGAPCKVADSTGSMPLPCTKTEWEAQTEEDWRREYYKARNSQTATSIQTFGDLVDAHRGSPADRLAKAKQLEAWNAGIDNLGVLLNLAVYMTRD